jgi:L-threonylcarbamoyladenylate synthase
MTAEYSPLLDKAVTVLQHHGVIAYPTEAVYGLGCDPFNEAAVVQLLQIKHRASSKGLILIAANWEQVAFLTQPLAAEIMAPIHATWPGPVTWIFPASGQVPSWIRGDHTTIALRITAHPIAHQLCEKYGKPLVSTSANRQGQRPARDTAGVTQTFGNTLDFVLPGKVGELTKPTEIREAISGKILRKGP